jgi:hypothetical protein
MQTITTLTHNKAAVVMEEIVSYVKRVPKYITTKLIKQVNLLKHDIRLRAEDERKLKQTPYIRFCQ